MASLIGWFSVGLLSVVALLAGSAPLRIGAIPVLVVFLLHLWDKRPRTWIDRIPGWVGESAGPALLVSMATILYGRLLIGDLPINHDHPVFLVRAWITGSQFLSSGQATGFSLTMFAGYPANALYSMGTDLLVNAMKATSLGLFSWETAYCWALFLFVVAYPLALYAIGRRFAGRLAGLVAGILGLLDRGLWFQSGWDFNLNWGVWSMGLSFTMCLFCFLALERLLTKATPLSFVATAVTMGFAILSHPMAVAILGVSLPIQLITMSVVGRLPAPGLWLPRVVGAFALGVGIASFWLVPFIGRQAWFEPLADPWHSFEDALRGLMDGTLLFQFCPAFLFGGVLGLLLGARRRVSFAWFLLVTSGLLLFFSSNTFLLTFGALKKFPSLANLQPQRFAYFIRTSLLLGCGFLVQTVVSGVRPGPDAGSCPSPVRHHVRRLLWAATLAPFLVFMQNVGPSSYLAPSKPLTWASQSPVYQDFRAATDYLGSLDRSSVDRVAVMAVTNEHLLMALPVYTGLDIFKVGFTPENNYRLKFESRDARVWKAVNVSHVLSIGSQHRQDLEEVRSFGKLHLYRFKEYSADRVTLRGEGVAVVERDEPEAMDVRLSGTRAGSQLVIHRGRYSLWEAELDGEPVPITGTGIGDSPPVFMQVPARDGLLRLRYRSGLAEWLGTILTWLSLITLGLVLAASRFQRLRRTLSRWLAPVSGPLRDGVTLVTLAVAAIVLIVVLVRLLSPARPSFGEREMVHDLSALLPRARGEVIRPARTQPCQPHDGVKIQCPGPSWNFAGEVIVSADHLLRQCIWLHPIQGAKFTLHFDAVPLGDFIQGFCAIPDLAAEPPSQHHVYLTVSLDDQELGRFTCPSRRGWFPWEVATPGREGTTGRVTIQSDAPFTGRRHFCFTAYTTRSERD